MACSDRKGKNGRNDRSGAKENRAVAIKGGNIAGGARKALEEETGISVIASDNAAQLNQLVVDVIEDISVENKIKT